MVIFTEKREDLINPGNQGLRDVLRNANDVVANGKGLCT